MDPEFLQGFIEQSEDYLPKIRGGILICAQEGNTFGELNTALRQIQSLRDAAGIVALDDIEKVCEELEEKLAFFVKLNQPITAEQSRQLLDKLTEFEILLARIKFSADDFSEDLDDIIDESFEHLGLTHHLSTPNEAIEEIESDEEEGFEIDEEMLEIFASEADDLIRNINENLGILAEKPDNREALLEIRRSAHTLKGSAGIVGLKKLSDVAHGVEDLLDCLTEKEVDTNDKIFELLLTATDCFAALASGENSEQLTKKIERIFASFDEIRQSLEKPEEISAVSRTNVPDEIAPSSETETAEIPPPAQNRSVVRVSLEKLDDLVKIVGGLMTSRSVFERQLKELERQIGELHNSTRRLQSSSSNFETRFEAEMLELPHSGFRIQKQLINPPFLHQQSSVDFDALEFDRYTEFHQNTRELVEITGDNTAITSELDTLQSNLEMIFENQRRLIDEMQNKLLRLRMVSFGSLTARLQRTVRVICEEEGKSADLFIEGENLEVDTQILDALIDPLLHLLRNAVAHGIELPEIRRLLGKDEHGKIFLRLVNEGTRIILTISDDGRGISTSALKEKAVRKAFITTKEAEQMSEAEAFSLIFLPGLTTAEKLSQISGRGVGMNIVKTNVERQQGTISIESETRRGTIFTIRLPMALAVTRALLVRTAEQIFAFPLNSVTYIGEISAEQLDKDKNIFQRGGANYAISHLSALLNLPGAIPPTGENIPLLLIENSDKRYALIVDEIIKPEEIVIKPLGSALQYMSELLGATILGDGNVVPVLDLTYLLENQNSRVKTQDLKAKDQKPKSKNLVVLIVDDSPSVRHLTLNIIKNAGWTALTAKDGIEALEILQDSRELPDIILSDVEMPKMDGYELLASLKRQKKLSEIPVVMITSRAGDKHRQRAFDLGVSAYLSKPFEDAALIKNIKNLTGK